MRKFIGYGFAFSRAVFGLKTWVIKSDREKFKSFEAGCVKACQICRYLRPLIIFSLIISFLLHLSKGEDISFHNRRLVLGGQIEQLLIDKKICDSKIKCQAGDFFTISPYPSGAAIKTFGITSNDVLHEIAKLLMSEFYSHRNMHIIFSSYAVSEEEYAGAIFSDPDPLYVLELNGKGK